MAIMLLLFGYCLLFSFAFGVGFRQEFIQWSSTEPTTFPYLNNEKQVSFESEGKVIQGNAHYFLHSSASLQYGVDILPEHREETKALTKFFRGVWKKSFTEFEFKIQLTSDSAVECADTAAVIL